MHGLTGGDWKRGRNLRKPRQSPTLPHSLSDQCNLGVLGEAGALVVPG
jgi:hypothetical protein